MFTSSVTHPGHILCVCEREREREVEIVSSDSFVEFSFLFHFIAFNQTNIATRTG